MEQGATSQLGVTTRARSGAIQPTPRGPLPSELPRLKAKERDQPKEMGHQSPRVFELELEHELDQDIKTTGISRGRLHHGLAPSAGKELMKPEIQTRGSPSLKGLEKKIHINWDRLRGNRLEKTHDMTTRPTQNSHKND
ncbi:hypothetical protein LIER_06787 [Lithospermum erythrorhizon]|uniref:Uncharacterized protein n=1 Tax=Lithospermum erythrorhizon TaxID=34254 RepID=A0AAV3P779_LITER